MGRIRSEHPKLSVNSRDAVVYDATKELEEAEANYNDNCLSYNIVFENGIRERNSNFIEDKEIEEQIAEESRILYVALTRAIRSCIWINNIDSAPHTSWATLLEG